MWFTEQDPLWDWTGLQSRHAHFSVSQARQAMEDAWQRYYAVCDSDDNALIADCLQEALAAERRYNRIWWEYNLTHGADVIRQALLDDDPTAAAWLWVDRSPWEIAERLRRVTLLRATQEGMDAVRILSSDDCACTPDGAPDGALDGALDGGRACLYCRTARWWHDRLTEAHDDNAE